MCVRWYLRFSLSLRDLEEIMAERGLRIDHTTIWRWTHVYGPEAQRRLQGQIKYKRSTWHIDETYIKVAGRWKYLFRAVDSSGATVDFYLSDTRDREAARCFCKRRSTIQTIRILACSASMATVAIQPRCARCKVTGNSASMCGAVNDDT